MRKDILDFSDFMERYIIRYDNISPLAVIPLDVLIGNKEKIKEGAANKRALNHMAQLNVIGPTQREHRVGLSSDASMLYTSVFEPLVT